MADKIIAACGGSVAGKTLAVLGLTFKPNTDDMRDSPSLAILPRLRRGRGDDRASSIPRAWTRRESCCPTSAIARTPTRRWTAPTRSCYLTEWNEFRALDLARVEGAAGKRRW